MYRLWPPLGTVFTQLWLRCFPFCPLRLFTDWEGHVRSGRVDVTGSLNIFVLLTSRTKLSPDVSANLRPLLAWSKFGIRFHSSALCFQYTCVPAFLQDMDRMVAAATKVRGFVILWKPTSSCCHRHRGLGFNTRLLGPARTALVRNRILSPFSGLESASPTSGFPAPAPAPAPAPLAGLERSLCYTVVYPSGALANGFFPAQG